MSGRDAYRADLETEFPGLSDDQVERMVRNYPSEPIIVAPEPDEDERPVLLVRGYNDALLGVAVVDRENGEVAVAVYSMEKIIQTLMDRDGMTWDDAVEFFDFNIGGAYVGDRTPIFVEPLRLEK